MSVNELLELNSEILRRQEMEFYRYHSYLNHISAAFDKFEDIESDEIRSVVLAFAKEIITRFTETYGLRKHPESLRKGAQEIIINKQWNFN